MEKSISPAAHALTQVQRGRSPRGQSRSPRGAYVRGLTGARLDRRQKVQKFSQSLSAAGTMSPQEPRGDGQRKVSLMGKLNR